MDAEPQHEQPSEFQRHGFLSETAQREAERFREQLPEWVRLYFALNEYAQGIFTTLDTKVRNKNPQHLLAFSGFYRALTAYQGVFLVVERGMDADAKTLLRSMTETAMMVTATARDKEFVVRYVRGSEHTRLRLLERVLSAADVSSFLTAEQVEQMKSDIAGLKKKRSEKREWNEEVKPWEIAEAAKLKGVYQQHYGYLCLYAHPGVTGMNQFLITDESGAITHFRIGRYDDDAEANLRIAVVMLLQTLSAISHLFKLGIGERLTEFESQLKDVISRSKTQKWAADSD